MSSSEGYQPSITSEEDFHSAQQLVDQTVRDTSSLEDDQPFDEVPNTELVSPINTALDPNLLGDDEVDHDLRAHAIKYRATLQYDENGQLQPIYPQPHGTLFKDSASNFVWRDRTMAERDLSASLDHARSSDLSIHLYNVYKLKQAARSQVPHESGFVETKSPPRNWTAWPMPPNLVPREYETKRWEDEEWRVGPYVKRERRPGDELRELLTARVLKTAKERLEERDSEDTPEDDEEGEYPKPVVIVDDNAAVKTLRPSIQHVTGKLDGVLMGLHQARSYYSTKRISKTKRPASKSDGSPTQGVTATRKRDMPSIEQGGSSAESTHSDVETSISEDSRLLKKQKGGNATVKGNNIESNLSRTGRLGLRDWSDILGIASMIGVDAAVVDRAASRCVDLLGEGMSFRTLHEDPREDNDTIYLPHGKI